jgi:hypothetical protein
VKLLPVVLPGVTALAVPQVEPPDLDAGLVGEGDLQVRRRESGLMEP